MGKIEDDYAPSTAPVISSSSSSDINGVFRSIAKTTSLKCGFVMVMGVAVLLSAVFWLPPFFKKGDLDQDLQFPGAYVVASFRVQRSVSLLNANIAKLQYDIYEEVGVPNSSVTIISMEPLAGLNRTNVVFGIWPNPKSTTISLTSLSIIRDNFMAFVTQQSTLHLTASLFGSSYFFQVLKFPGGITIIPQQSAFLLQKVHILFNFTLNFPIYEVQDKLFELKAQMKSGLLLTSYENLYVSLTNLKGSTVAPPTVVQTSVVLAVGNRQPSIPRLRQLAQTIRSSSHGNLGLNHTVFGRVKQIQLSSFLTHSLNGGGNGVSISPSPAPQPQIEHHQHHHQHPHQHRTDINFAPTPAPQHTYKSSAPSGCHSVLPNKTRSNAHIVPVAAPVDSRQSSPAPNEDPPSLPPLEDSPAPAPHLFQSPLPHVVVAHAHPPSERGTTIKPPEGISSISPSPFSSSVAGQPSAVCWILATLLYLLAHL